MYPLVFEAKLYHEAIAESGMSQLTNLLVATLDQSDFNLLYCAPMADSVSNIYELLGARVANAPDKSFLFSEADDRKFSYRQFQAAVDRAAAMLVSQHIGKGDVVSLLMPNSAEYVVAYFACWKLGALAGPVNSLLKEHEVEFVMNNSEAKAVLVNSEFRDRIENMRGDLPRLRSVITFADEAEACPRYPSPR